MLFFVDVSYRNVAPVRIKRGLDLQKFLCKVFTRKSIVMPMLVLTIFAVFSSSAHATYWNVFNNGTTSAFKTYDTLLDTLQDVNSTGTFDPTGSGLASALFGSGSDGSTYWNVFNNGTTSAIKTYSNSIDMFGDVNSTGTFDPVGSGLDSVLFGSGSDGATYWNVFNNGTTSAIKTYINLSDMLGDVNSTGTFDPVGSGLDSVLFGSGSDGATYWNVFNNGATSAIKTYANLGDMLGDVNSTGTFDPVGSGLARVLFGSGADILDASSIPEPGTLSLLVIALAGISALTKWHRPAATRVPGHVEKNGKGVR